MKPINVSWCFGRVVNVDDPQKSGRVQVRLHGFHESSPQKLPDEFLPWARLTTPSTSPNTAEGVGLSPTGATVGMEFLGIALDTMYQNILVLNTWWANDEENSQVHPLARGVMSALSQQVEDNRTTGIPLGSSNTVDEPSIVRNTTYPLNDVEKTRSGRETEVDNSGEGVRVTDTHPSGNYTNLDQQGNESQKRQSKFSLIVGRVIRRIGGSRFLSVGGNMVDWIAMNLYQRAAQQVTQKSNNHLIKADTALEVQSPEVRLQDVLRVGGVIYVPELRVGTIKADNMSIANPIDGVAKFASEAVKAASVSPPVVPIPGSGAGDTSTSMSLEDNGGNYPLD